MKTIEEEIKSKFTSPQQKAHINLIYTHNWIISYTNKIFKEYEITMQQYNVLRILNGSYPKTKTPTEVKEVMLDKNPDLTRLVDRLIKKNWVEREECKVNRRQVNLKITEQGREYLKIVIPKIDEATNFSKNLSDKEAESLSKLLDKIRA